MVYRSACIALLITLGTPSVAAEPSEINYPEGSLGFAALMRADLKTAEDQLRLSPGVADDDPARLINLGGLLSRTGRPAEGILLLERAASGEDIDLVLADGRTVSSRETARKALAKLRRGYAER